MLLTQTGGRGGRGGGGPRSGRVRGWGERAQARSILVNLGVICVVSTKQKTVQKRKTLVVFGGGSMGKGERGRTKRCF